MATTPMRDRILDASRALCVEHGFGALTMRRVADRVGVSAPAIYRHFAGKPELVRSLLDDARALFMSYLVTALDESSPRARLDRAGVRYLEFGLEQPHAYEMLFMTPNQIGLFGTPSSIDDWRAQPPDTFQFAVDRVAECMRAGDLATAEPTRTALGMSALAHGMVSLWLAGRFGSDEARFRALYGAALETYYAGVGTDG